MATFCLQLQRARHTPDSAINVCSPIDFAFSLFFLPSGCRLAGLLKVPNSEDRFQRGIASDARSNENKKKKDKKTLVLLKGFHLVTQINANVLPFFTFHQ